MFRKHLQNSACDSESSLGWLIGVRCGADDYRLALEQTQMAIAAEAQSSAQNLGRVFLDEDIALEGEPGRQFVICFAELLNHFMVVGSSLHHPAVGVSCVAVSAAERAADVGIDRPESHAGGLGTVEDALRRRRVVPDVLLLADDRELAGLALVSFAEQARIDGLDHTRIYTEKHEGKRRCRWRLSAGSQGAVGGLRTADQPPAAGRRQRPAQLERQPDLSSILRRTREEMVVCWIFPDP